MLRVGFSPSHVTGIQVNAQGPQNFGQNAWSRTSEQNYHDWTVAAQHLWAIGSNKVNELRFQYAYRGLLYNFSHAPGGSNPAVNIAGFEVHRERCGVPLPEVRSMDGAVTARMADPARWGRLASSLARREKRSYERITYPDVLVVLRVEPDVVVERRRADPESMLRSRSAEVWSMDWRRTPAVVIDGSLPKDEVLSAVKAAIWTKV